MRTALAAIALALLAPLTFGAAAAADDPGWTSVAEGECVAGPDAENAAVPDWADLCGVDWRTIVPEDGPTTFEVRLRVVGSVADRVGQAGYLTTWTAGECELELYHRDGSDIADAGDVLSARCGDWETVCEDTTGMPGVFLLFDCRDVGDLVLDAPIAPPTFTDDTITWSITFDGDLAPLAGVHAGGATLLGGKSVAGQAAAVDTGTIGVGPAVSSEVRPYPVLYCVTGFCGRPFAARLDSEATYVVR